MELEEEIYISQPKENPKEYFDLDFENELVFEINLFLTKLSFSLKKS